LLWNSPTVATLLGNMVVPLRFLVLTPLVIARLDIVEFDAYFLLASVAVLGKLIMPAFTDVYSKMLGFAYAGKTDLSPLLASRGIKSNDASEPNWPSFLRCYETLRLFQLVGGVLFGGLTMLFAWLGLTRMVGAEMLLTETRLWHAGVLVSITNMINISFASYTSALRATDKVVDIARNALVFSLFMTIGAALALVLGGGIVHIFAINLLAAIGSVSSLRRKLLNYFPAIRDVRPKFHREVFSWSWAPLWRSIVGALSTKGARRTTHVLLAGSLANGQLGAFLFTLSLIEQCFVTLESLVGARIPRFVKMLANSKISELSFEMVGRIFATIMAYAGALLTLGLIMPLVCSLLGKEDRFISGAAWWILATTSLLFFIQKMFEKVENLANTKRFWMNRVMGGLAVVLLFLAFAPDSPQQAAWFYFLPGVIAMGFKPFQLAALRLETSFTKLFKNGVSGVKLAWSEAAQMLRPKESQ